MLKSYLCYWIASTEFPIDSVLISLLCPSTAKDISFILLYQRLEISRQANQSIRKSINRWYIAPCVHKFRLSFNVCIYLFIVQFMHLKLPRSINPSIYHVLGPSIHLCRFISHSSIDPRSTHPSTLPYTHPLIHPSTHAIIHPLSSSFNHHPLTNRSIHL